MTDMDHFHRLPDGVLLQVLETVPPADLENVALISNSMLRIAKPFLSRRARLYCIFYNASPPVWRADPKRYNFGRSKQVGVNGMMDL